MAGRKPVRVDYGQGRRQSAALARIGGHMVVGDDHLGAAGVGVGHSRVGSHTRIAGEDQARPSRQQAVDAGLVHAMPSCRWGRER